MSHTVRFAVDPRLARLLGDNYRSTEQAIKELIDNAWDADADEVHVQLPAEMSSDPIVVSDNGSGMTEEELRTEYLRVARDRRSIRGDRTGGRKRQVRGRKGIGKFAGLMVADEMHVTSRARGRAAALVIDSSQIRNANIDFEAIEIPFSADDCDAEAHGTTVVLSHLNRRLAHPSAEKLRRIVILDYGRAADFKVFVNGEQATLRDIPGDTYHVERDLPSAGRVVASFAIADIKQVVKHPGIVIKVNGKPIGAPTFFGLDEAEDIPPQVLKRIYGEVEAGGLLDDVTEDGGAVIENSVAFREVEAFLQDTLREELQRTFKKEFDRFHLKINQQIAKRVAELPEYRRPYARAQLEKILVRFYGESEEKIEAIVTLVLDALERDEYWEIIRALHNAEQRDVQTLADALTSFGLLEIVHIGRQATSRLEVLNGLDKLISNPDTLERQLHQVFGHNLWLLGSAYALVSSNRTMKNVVEGYLKERYEGVDPAKRPDLLLLGHLHGDHLLIEFKRPRKAINRDDETQAQKYRDDLGRRIHPVRILLVGGTIEENLRLNPGHNIEYVTYTDLVARARAEIEWLLERLSEPSTTFKLSVL